MLKEALAWTISFSLLFAPGVAYGDEAEESVIDQAKLVTTLEKDEAAPFSGTLFSTAAAASLLAQIELSEESCQLEINRQVDLTKAEYQLQIDTLDAKVLRLETNYNDMLEIKTGQINYLDAQLQKASKPKNELWFALGVVGGVIITGTAAWGMGQIANPQ